MQYKVIPNSQLPVYRAVLLARQANKCAICGDDLGEDTTNQHVDHQHLFKTDELGVHGNGLIRGVLCRNCNALEGKIWNNIHRYGFADPANPVGSRGLWLAKLLQYYAVNFQSMEAVLHPKENRVPKISKSEYNQIKKWFEDQAENYKRSGELKAFPKFTGKWTPRLYELAERANEL